MDRASGHSFTRETASAGDGSAEGDHPKQQPQMKGVAAAAKPPKRTGLVAVVEDAVAVVFAILVLLNFASAAFIEAVCYCAFKWWWPQVRTGRRMYVTTFSPSSITKADSPS